MSARQQLILRHRHALGDSVVFSGLVRDIARTYGDRFDIHVHCTFQNDIFEHSPYCRIWRGGDPPANALDLRISYRAGIMAAGRGQRIHMLRAFHQDFSRKTGLPLEPLEPHGDLHLPPEMDKRPVEEPYWVVVAGGKEDVTCKWWLPECWQKVVDLLRAANIQVVQAGIRAKGHWHATLTGVINMLDKTLQAREFINLIRHSEGVVCGITAAMHIAACFDKPCVVVAGGREEPWWEGYVNTYNAFGPKCSPVKVEHRYLHTVGHMACCQKKGCWKHRTVALNDGTEWDKMSRRCPYPVRSGAHVTPRCLAAIKPEDVANSVLSYYGGTEPETRTLVTMPTTALPSCFHVPPAPKFSETAPAGDLKNDFEIARRPAEIDSPAVGGRLTVCLLCTGSDASAARASLDSVRKTLPWSCADWRLGIMGASTPVLTAADGFLQEAVSAGCRVSVFREDANIGYFAMMRKMLAGPWNTTYVVWMDSGTLILDPAVWGELCRTLVADGPALYGIPATFNLRALLPTADPLIWFKRAKWWQHREVLVDAIPYVLEWFWAAPVALLEAADIPDARLTDTGGDVTIGLQALQAGFPIRAYWKEKQMVRHAGRRRSCDPPPWCKAFYPPAIPVIIGGKR